jgi:DNA-binding LacI/PurR family transcriptional regulator
MATRRDVAYAAGVSLRTVSNVVNGHQHIASSTRSRVQAVIEELGYRPSELARSLKVGRSGLVGLMLPELDTPYFAELTRFFVEEGDNRGYTVVIDQTDGDLDRERDFIARTDHGALFDASILSPLALRSSDVGELGTQRPIVFLGEELFPGFDKVMVDNFQAAREAVALLATQGRTRIAAIGAEHTRHGSSDLRLAGYKAALHDAGLKFDHDLIAYVSAFRRPDGAAAIRQLAQRQPDAVFCFADPLALGAMRALHELGIRVPDDVAIVGFDDIEDGRFSIPSLTTVSPDKRWIAHKAFELLDRKLDGSATKEANSIDAPYEIVRRESA